MITIILNHHKKYAEVEMPAMYEELQLALWKLGLDRVPEKYTLQDLDATFRYQSPLEYFVLRLLEGEMNLMDHNTKQHKNTIPAEERSGTAGIHREDSQIDGAKQKTTLWLWNGKGQGRHPNRRKLMGKTPLPRVQRRGSNESTYGVYARNRSTL